MRITAPPSPLQPPGTTARHRRLPLQPRAAGARPSPDGNLRPHGTAWALGEDALSALALRWDSVDNALDLGPHDGVMFAGTRGGGGDPPRPAAILESSPGYWRALTARLQAAAADDPRAAEIRETLYGDALRRSLLAMRSTAAWVDAP